MSLATKLSVALYALGILVVVAGIALVSIPLAVIAAGTAITANGALLLLELSRGDE